MKTESENFDAQLRWFLEYAKTFIHTPYEWGGDDPQGQPGGDDEDDQYGIDCSGLVIECLKAIGRIGLTEDLTAAGIFDRFKAYQTKNPRPGCLAFWANPQSGHIYHVAICLDSFACLTADGGDSSIDTAEAAAVKNARVKIRRTDHRKHKPIFVNIFKEV